MARPSIKKPNITEVEYIAHRLAQELMEYGEPIPPFDTRYPDKLESCLKTPFQTNSISNICRKKFISKF